MFSPGGLEDEATEVAPCETRAPQTARVWVTRAGDERYELRPQSGGGEEQPRPVGEKSAPEKGYATVSYRTAQPGTGHRVRTAPPRAREGQRARPRARVVDGSALRRPRLGGVGAAGRGVSASGRRRRAQQSRPTAATHCPAPARYRPGGLSAARRAARPRDRAGPRGRSPVRTNFPAAAPHLRERSTASAASWPAAPGPRAPGDRAPVAAVVADPVESGEPGEVVAALAAAAAPSSRGAHAAVPTRRPERDIRYIVGIPRASRDPLLPRHSRPHTSPGGAPAASFPAVHPLRPAGRFLRRPARPPPALSAARLGSCRFPSSSYQSAKKKKKFVHGPWCQPRKVEPALETGAPNKKPGRLTIRA